MKWPQEAQKAHKGTNRFTGVSGELGCVSDSHHKNESGIHYVPSEPFVAMALVGKSNPCHP
jgi:hypothetical protein